MSDMNHRQAEGSSQIIVTVTKNTDTGEFGVGLLFDDDYELIMTPEQAQAGMLEITYSIAIANKLNVLRDRLSAEDLKVVMGLLLVTPQ